MRALLLAFLLVLGIAGCTPPEASSQKDEATQGQLEQDGPQALADKADIPIYPDADLPEGQSNTRTDGKQTRYELVMLTNDSPAAVHQFYVQKLGLDSKEISDGVYDMIGPTPKKNLANIKIQREGEMTKIVAVSIVIAEG